MKKILVTFFAILFLAACATSTPTEVTITELEYKQALGLAVCAAVNDLNSRGLLADEEALEHEFDPLIQKFILAAGYESDEWLQAKATYFPDEEEHTKLVKLHFTWCLIGDSFEE